MANIATLQKITFATRINKIPPVAAQVQRQTRKDITVAAIAGRYRTAEVQVAAFVFTRMPRHMER
jgi:hypothetical protein